MGKLSRREAVWHNAAAELLYLGRMNSFNRFCPGLVNPELPVHWADDFYATLPLRELTEAEQRAGSLRYRVLLPGMPFSQARVPRQQRRAWPDIPELIWALLSPERTVLDAIRLHDAALSRTTSDTQIDYYLSYFRFLEEHGYLKRQ